MRLSDDVYAQEIAQRTENNEITWRRVRRMYPFSEFEMHCANFEDVELCIFLSVSSAGEAMTGGNRIFLEIVQNGQRNIIIEPAVHISQQMLGKWLLEMAGAIYYACEKFFVVADLLDKIQERKGWRATLDRFFNEAETPQTPQGREDERLRVGLNNLFAIVTEKMRLSGDRQADPV